MRELHAQMTALRTTAGGLDAMLTATTDDLRASIASGTRTIDDSIGRLSSAFDQMHERVILKTTNDVEPRGVSDVPSAL
jgi:hypothetical protein